MCVGPHLKTGGQLHGSTHTSSVMPALSSARSSLAPLVLLLAMRHGQGLIPQSKQASRVFSSESAARGTQQTCRTAPNARRPATAAPPLAGSRTGTREVMTTSAAAADGSAAEDVRQVCVKILHSYGTLHVLSTRRSNTPPCCARRDFLVHAYRDAFVLHTVENLINEAGPSPTSCLW